MGLEPGEGEPVYLEFADALELYAAIIGGTVAQAGDQLRGRGGLESALGRGVTRWKVRWAVLHTYHSRAIWYVFLMSHRSRLVLGDRGRLVLPSTVRKALRLEPGTEMLVTAEDDGSVRLTPYRAVAEQNRGVLGGLAPADVSMVDELLAARREEAGHEDAG